MFVAVVVVVALGLDGVDAGRDELKLRIEVVGVLVDAFGELVVCVFEFTDSVLEVVAYVVDALFVAKTAIAMVWRVRLGSGPRGGFETLPRSHMGNEFGGGIYLQGAGDLAVSILDQSADALLMS